MPNDFEGHVSGIAALADPVRRRIYDYVVSQPSAVSRDAAADAAQVKRSLAVFHLDKLVAEGLLDVEYRRLTGKTGPGAGRPAKLYRRADASFEVTLPPREYDVAGWILAAAIEQASESGTDVPSAVKDVAFDFGRSLASVTAGSPQDAIVASLSEHGFEPRVEDGDVRLANCPFHALAQEFTPLVCGMNLALCEGVAEAVTASSAGLTAKLDPQPGYCCVVFEKTS